MNEKIVLFDTSIASFNKGDDIIMRSLENILKEWLDYADVYKLPTHIPVFTEKQCKHPNYRVDFFRDIDTKFLCGTDIISKFRPYHFGQWDMNFDNCDTALGVVCVGVGYSPGSGKPRYNFIKRGRWEQNTKPFYSKVLSNKYIHSARDEVTAQYLNSIDGIQAINTGCVTTWMLTPDFCRNINTKKKDSVTFTLNCRFKQPENDVKFIHLLQSMYKTVYFYPQQWQDIDYINELNAAGGGTLLTNIHILPMSISKLHEHFLRDDMDYVGLRLHCGIFAMQHGIRSIIVQADHRSGDMSDSQHFNLVDRYDWEKIQRMIMSDLVTDVNVNYDNINIFLHQFGWNLTVDGVNTKLEHC